MRVLVLSGGGDKGSYQVGALRKWLAEDSIEYDVFCGISVGSINSAFLAQFPAGESKGCLDSSRIDLESGHHQQRQEELVPSWSPRVNLEDLNLQLSSTTEVDPIRAKSI